MTGRCPHCGWSDSDPFHVLSRHPTADGLTAWIRCACGSLQVWQFGPAGARLLVRGRPDPARQLAGALRPPTGPVACSPPCGT